MDSADLVIAVAPAVAAEVCPEPSGFEDVFRKLACSAMATAPAHRDAALQQPRFLQMERLLRRVGWRGGGPTFLTLAGAEYDFRTWRCDFPASADEWQRSVGGALRMQAAAALQE